MLIALAGLGLLVLFLASKAPDVKETPLPPNDAVPALGATGAPSPAKANGAPTINKTNELALNTTYKLVANNAVGIQAAMKSPKAGTLTSFQKTPSPNVNVMPAPQANNAAFTGGAATIHSKGGLVKL